MVGGRHAGQAGRPVRRGERRREAAHRVGGGEVLERVSGRDAIDVGAAAQQLGGVDRAVAQSAGGGDFDVEHDRQGEGEVTGHLNYASDRCQRHPGGGGGHRAMLMAGGTAGILPSGRHPATGNEG